MGIIGATEVKKKLIGMIHLLREIPGLSAYEIAVKNGFRGTEAEWLASLKGEKGDIGTMESHSDIDAQGHRVVNVAEPAEDTDAVNKGYVDPKVTGSHITEGDSDVIIFPAENISITTFRCRQGDVVSITVNLTHQKDVLITPGAEDAFYGNNTIGWLNEGYTPMYLTIEGVNSFLPLRAVMFDVNDNIIGFADVFIKEGGEIKVGGFYDGNTYDAYHSYHCHRMAFAFTCICK